MPHTRYSISFIFPEKPKFQSLVICAWCTPFPETILPFSGIKHQPLAGLGAWQSPELNIRSGRGGLGIWLFLKLLNDLLHFNSAINILGLPMHLPWACLLSSPQNVCTAIFPSASHVLIDLCP